MSVMEHSSSLIGVRRSGVGGRRGPGAILALERKGLDLGRIAAVQLRHTKSRPAGPASRLMTGSQARRRRKPVALLLAAEGRQRGFNALSAQ
jgi:hypothetical protein